MLRSTRGLISAVGGTVGGAIALLTLPPLSLATAAEFPPCPPPAATEYLLLVRSNSETERSQVQNVLPANNPVMVCQYLDDTVVRAGGFNSLESANAWAQYMTEVQNLQAFVARPADGQGGEVAETPAAETPTIAYAPQRLTEGFTVLVDYRNQPEMALAVQQLLNQPVGVGVFQQRPYLMLAPTQDAAAAAQSLRSLNQNGFVTLMVEASQVVMLAPQVGLRAAD
jgi:hypothetical protein